MPKQIDLEEIAKNNPHLDLNKLEEWRKLRAELPRGGPKKPPYQGFPFQGRRARVVDDQCVRIVRLTRKFSA